MANRKMDSFNHYATADIGSKWGLLGDGTELIDVAAARLGTTGLILHTNASVGEIFDSQAIWTVGFACRVPSFGANTICQLIDTSTIQLSLSIDAIGRLVVSNGSGTVLGTSAPVINLNVWHYIEFQATINNTTGTYEVRVDMTNVLSGTGADTQNSANASANIVKLTSTQTGTHFADFYCNDATGSAPNNTFWGDTRIQPLLPSGAGATTQWTPSAGSNFQNVDDATPDGDTTYNSSSTLNQVDTYAYSNLTPTAGTVFAVQVLTYARKDDAGTRSIAPVIRHSGTDHVGTTQSLSTSYQYHAEIHEENPGTAAAWTIAEVNAAEFGVKLTA